MDLMTATTTATSTIYSATDKLLDYFNFQAQMFTLGCAVIVGFLVLLIVITAFKP